jgi:hypothetical protein
VLRRFARWLAWPVLGIAVAAVLLMALSLLEIGWTGASLGGADLHRGRLTIRWRGSAGSVAGPVPGWRFGAPSTPLLQFTGPGWIAQRDWSAWFCNGTTLRGGPNPPGPGGGLVVSIINVPLWRTAVVAGAAGGLLFLLSRRRLAPHQCPQCGYNLAGLGVRAACPECGSVHGRRRNSAAIEP